MFKATLSNTSLLIDSVSTIAELIDEGIFKISKEGISLVAADRAMVAAVDFNLSASAFEKYEIDEPENIGLNIGNFLSVLKRAKGGDKLTLILHNSKLQVLIENSGKRRFTVPLLDLSQEEVPLEQLEFTVKTELKPEVLQSGIEDAEIVADSVVFEVSPSKFLIKGEGDISRAELELEKGNKALLEIKSEGEVKARYPLEYLKKIIKASKMAEKVSLEFGQDYPMRIRFQAGDKCTLNFILAPRVSEE